MMLMWIDTGIPSSTAAAQKGSSSCEMFPLPAGQLEISTPLAPRAFALRSESTALSMPSDGICASPIKRVGSAAQNSSNRKLLYASTPARTKSSSSSPLRLRTNRSTWVGVSERVLSRFREHVAPALAVLERLRHLYCKYLDWIARFDAVCVEPAVRMVLESLRRRFGDLLHVLGPA